MSFGSTLKTILTINGIKMYNLANALGYDKSYISKWINGAKLPPSKEIDTLIDSIVSFITVESTERSKQQTALHFGFSTKEKATPDNAQFSKKLTEILRENYWKDRYGAGHDTPTILTAAPLTSPQRTRKQQRRGGPAIECFLATQPINSAGEFQSVRDDLAALDPDNTRLKITALIDSQKFSEHVDLYWKHICSLLSIGSNADVDLYEINSCDNIQIPDRLLIAKDCFVEQTIRLPFSNKTVSVKSDVPSVIDLYYDDARKFIRQHQSMMESSVTNNNLYYYKYSDNTPKRYLLSSMFPMYMSVSLYDELLGKYGEPSHKDERARNSYLKEFATSKSVVIFESALLRYMSTGKISAFDAYEGETLTRQERRQHLQELIYELEDGTRFDLKVLSDKNPILNYSDISGSFFMNETSAYYSDIRKKKDGVRYFVSADSRRNLSTLLEHINDLPAEYLLTGKGVIDYIFDGMRNI